MFGDTLAFQERLTACCGGGVPLPVNVSFAGEFEALLVNDMLPDATPVPEGVNVTVNPTCWPAGIVTGKVTPPRAKADPFTVAEFTMTLAPVALSVPFCWA